MKVLIITSLLFFSVHGWACSWKLRIIFIDNEEKTYVVPEDSFPIPILPEKLLGHTCVIPPIAEDSDGVKLRRIVCAIRNKNDEQNVYSSFANFKGSSRMPARLLLGISKSGDLKNDLKEVELTLRCE